MGRLVVANFDCELDFARASCPGPVRGLPQKVRQALAVAARHLEVFATPEDRIWTVADEPVVDYSKYDRVLFWGQSMRNDPVGGVRDVDVSLEDMWSLGCTTSIAAKCNDKRFCQSVGIAQQWRLETVCVDSLEELDVQLAQAALGPEDGWVAKAIFSASGRERVKRRGRVLAGEMRVRARRLLECYGRLVFEPWMERVADYGAVGIVADSVEKSRVFAPHQLLCDSGGVFRGVRVSDVETSQILGREFSSVMSETSHKVLTALYNAGYRGPFGFDAFTYRDCRGHVRLQSLCEINARMSFGHIARAQAERSGQGTWEFRL